MDSVINLEPRSMFPGNPSEGDLCIVGAQGDRHIYCYLNDNWVPLDTPGNKIPPSE
ncbi:MAG: hypothetical protein ACYSUX_07125 [Planctomycetota bacterium]|jgi:hypothetical protein